MAPRKKKLETYEDPDPVPKEMNVVTENDRLQMLNLVCIKVRITAKLVKFIGICEILFLTLTLILTIAHFARYSPLINRMSDILIVIIVGVAIGILSTVLLFVGLNKDKLALIKLHYTLLAVASCLLLLCFVFIFTSVYGEFDETYLYGEYSPPILIALGVIWCLATPLSLIACFIVRQYYKILQERIRRVTKLKKSYSNYLSTSTMDENQVRDENCLQHSNEIVKSEPYTILETPTPMNGPPSIPFKANGSVLTDEEPTVVVCNSARDELFETTITAHHYGPHSSNEGSDEEGVEVTVGSDGETVSTISEEGKESDKEEKNLENLG